MTVDANNVGNRVECLRKREFNARLAHIEIDFGRLDALIGRVGL